MGLIFVICKQIHSLLPCSQRSNLGLSVDFTFTKDFIPGFISLLPHCCAQVGFTAVGNEL